MFNFFSQYWKKLDILNIYLMKKTAKRCKICFYSSIQCVSPKFVSSFFWQKERGGKIRFLPAFNSPFPRPAVLSTSSFPGQRKKNGHLSLPNTSGLTGVKISRWPVNWLLLLRPRWKSSICTPQSVISQAFWPKDSCSQSSWLPQVSQPPCASLSSPRSAGIQQNGQIGEEQG